MSSKRKNFSSQFKAKVALEAIKGYKTISQLAKDYQVHPNVIGNWKKQLLDEAPGIFDNKRGPKVEDKENVDILYQQIGRLQVELEWLKKKYNSIS